MQTFVSNEQQKFLVCLLQFIVHPVINRLLTDLLKSFHPLRTGRRKDNHTSATGEAEGKKAPLKRKGTSFI